MTGGMGSPRILGLWARVVKRLSAYLNAVSEWLLAFGSEVAIVGEDLRD
jgi:hypothetical protein